MKVKVNVLDLREGLAQAAITLDKRKYMGAPLIYMLARKTEKAQRLLIYTSDGMAESLVRLECEVLEDGEVAMEPSRLQYLLGMAPAEETAQLALTSKGNQIGLKIGKGTQSKMAVNSTASKMLEEIKHLPITKEPDLLIKAEGFREVLERTQNFTSGEADKLNLQSVVIQTGEAGYEALASDGKVLARVSVDDENVKGKKVAFRIPHISIPALRKVLDRNKKSVLKVIFDRTPEGEPQRMYVRTDNTVYGTTLSAEPFPITDKIFSASIVVSVKLPAKSLAASMSQADLFANDSFVAVLMDQDQVKIRSGGQHGEFEQELAAEAVTWPEGTKPTKMGFNVGKLMMISRALRDEDVELGYAEGLKMAFVQTQNEAGAAKYVIAGCRETASAAAA
jgi:DNA polymerase III sliding clamp (beta) subunit (PCNA family)